MNKEETEKRANVMLAYVRGEAIQYYNANAERWEDIKDPLWDSRCEYRVKPKKRVMPYKNGKDLVWKVDLPTFLKEVCECSKGGAYTKCFSITFHVLRMLTERAIELNDPVLNAIMINLGLYEGSHTEEVIRQKQKMVDEFLHSDTYRFKKGELVMNLRTNTVGEIVAIKEDFGNEQVYSVRDCKTMEMYEGINVAFSKLTQMERAEHWLRERVTFDYPDCRHAVPMFDDEDIADFRRCVGEG